MDILPHHFLRSVVYVMEKFEIFKMKVVFKKSATEKRKEDKMKTAKKKKQPTIEKPAKAEKCKDLLDKVSEKFIFQIRKKVFFKNNNTAYLFY